MKPTDVPLWYGVIFMVNMQMAFLSPPFGYSLFYLKSVAPPEITMATIFRAAREFHGAAVARRRALHRVPADRLLAAERSLRTVGASSLAALRWWRVSGPMAAAETSQKPRRKQPKR